MNELNRIYYLSKVLKCGEVCRWFTPPVGLTYPRGNPGIPHLVLLSWKTNKTFADLGCLDYAMPRLGASLTRRQLKRPIRCGGICSWYISGDTSTYRF